MSELGEPEDLTVPQTGVSAVDEALAALDLSGDVADHPEQFAQAVEVLQTTLRGSGAR